MNKYLMPTLILQKKLFMLLLVLLQKLFVQISYILHRELNKDLGFQEVLEYNEEGGYTVTVPALPGCLTEGDTVEEALENAKEP